MLYLSSKKSNAISESPNSIPISIFPPVVLERPLKYFGKSFPVHISTGMTFSPDTILQATCGMSLREFARIQDDTVDTLLNALWRGATKRNKLSATTSYLIKQRLLKSNLIASESIDKLLIGDETESSEPWKSDWESLLQIVTADRDDSVYLLIERLAKIDRAAYSARISHDSGVLNEENLKQLENHVSVTELFEAWQQCSLKLLLPVALLVDVSLQTLAWLELRVQPSDCDSQVLKFLVAGKKPLGHWLLAIQESANCSNLEQLSTAMAKLKITHHGKVISHDLLKKWSSGQQLMPKAACECVLDSAGKYIDKSLWWEYFAAARFLSFLCDLLIAGSCGEAPPWKLVQANLFERYESIYKSEITKLRPITIMCSEK